MAQPVINSDNMNAAEDITRVTEYLTSLQDSITAAIQRHDPDAALTQDSWKRDEGGGGRSRVFKAGKIFEQAGVNFSHVFGDKLPPSATANRPALAGRGFQAMGVSLVFHRSNTVLWKHGRLRSLAPNSKECL